LAALESAGGAVSRRYGQIIAMEFTANAGDTLAFDWNFLTSEFIPSTYDYGLADIERLAVGDAAFPLADRFFSTFQASSATGFNEETGFNTFSYTVPGSNPLALDYELLLIVYEEGDSWGYSSGLLLDNFSVTPAPEPTTPLLLGCGLAVLSAARKLWPVG
jgi:hypothetical protein